MMIEVIDDCFLNVNWIDLKQNTHPIGFLCLYNDKFYFKVKSKEDLPCASNNGYDDIPGIEPNRIYVSSNELFNIFKKRLGFREGNIEKIETMKEVLSKRIDGESSSSSRRDRNRRDRIRFEKMSERERAECQKEIDNIEQQSNKNVDTYR